MLFRTTFEIPALQRAIDLNSKILLLGSCFTEHIGGLLQKNKFNAAVNPSGILFHPLAIARSIERGLDIDTPSPDTFFQSAGAYRHFDFHSELSHPELPVALGQVQKAVMQMHQALQDSTHIIISFGTSLIYEDVRTGIPVSNNHKLPANRFRKRQLSVEEIVHVWQSIMDRVDSRNTIEWIFTVSPVRHIREGIVQNMRSKSVLIEAVHRLLQFRSSVSYFPAYEVMMDDLRDYRFYAEDMVHPSAVAIEYIWEQFSTKAIDNSAQNWIAKWHPVLQALEHRPFFPESPEHQAFRKSRYALLKDLHAAYPQLDLSQELAFFS